MAFLAVVEVDKLETNLIVDPVRATMIKTNGRTTTRTKTTSRKAAMAERELFARQRLINGLNSREKAIDLRVRRRDQSIRLTDD